MPKIEKPRREPRKMTAPATVGKKRAQTPPPPPPPDDADCGGHYISPSNLARRWDTSRTSVDCIAKDEKFGLFMVGKGSVRYLKEEVIAYESSRTLR